MHQNKDFKRFSDIRIQRFFLKSLIDFIKRKIQNVNALNFQNIATECSKYRKHPLFHDCKIKTKSHVFHNINIYFTLQQRCEQCNNLLLKLTYTFDIFIFETKMDDFLFSFKASDILSTAVKDFGID